MEVETVKDFVVSMERNTILLKKLQIIISRIHLPNQKSMKLTPNPNIQGTRIEGIATVRVISPITQLGIQLPTPRQIPTHCLLQCGVPLQMQLKLPTQMLIKM